MKNIFEIVNNICHAVFITSYHSAEQNNPVNCFVRGCCGIFQDITKRFRNAFHLCGMTNGKDTNNCHTALVAVSKDIKRCRNKYGMTKNIQSGMTLRKLVAFTLAETLIVMGIIGIVSALTLPNLNSSTGEKEKVAKVKKIHQNLEDAIGRAIAVYGPMDEWIVNDTTASAQATRFGDRITEFMKVSKNCSILTSNPCFGNGKTPKTSYSGFEAKSIDGSNDVYKFILADGTSMAIHYSTNYASANDVWFFFDIDGPNKGQSYLGADLFSFHYNLPSATLRITEFDKDPNLSAMTTGRGGDATGWVVRYDNMDYLKADGNNGKCKNSNVTLNPNANPPVTSCK